MSEVAWLNEEIAEWFKTTDHTFKSEWHDAFGLLVEILELSNDTIILPSGKVISYYTSDFLAGDTDEQLFVFKVDDEFYALRGWADSWESSWDFGPYKVEERQVTVNQWFIVD